MGGDLAPSADELHALAVATVEDFASDALLDKMQIDDAFALTGVYDGIPLTEKNQP